jgi:DNA polymerase-1
MQGSAADIIKRAMIKVYEWLPASGYDAKLLMQVHDELILEVREDQAETFAVELKTQMQCAAALDVPLIVDVGIGDNWEQAH